MVIRTNFPEICAPLLKMISEEMFVRAGDFKVRFFSEELPHDDYPTQHCTAGSPHGEFFQTWGCYGAGITFHDPPQIFDISSD